ncbi:hypothetical protein COB55_03535 [Candidatus Wolfebacteria bacterium]|nr:MAG: hypothetical protein COB55_03535 [Candidatus Wolfebacteria bacterium]
MTEQERKIEIFEHIVNCEMKFMNNISTFIPYDKSKDDYLAGIVAKAIQDSCEKGNVSFSEFLEYRDFDMYVDNIVKELL